MTATNRRALALYLLLALLFCALCALFLYITGNLFPRVEKTAAPPARIVILDAGHGGEDGGASAADGTLEKDLNLSLVLSLKAHLESNGITVVLTRESDTLLYDRNADYEGKKKKLDMQARLAVAEAHPDAIFISIHMNTYPTAAPRGLQVWYSGNDPDSERLAATIQATVQAKMQPENHRKIKPAGSGIWLLKKIRQPAVLVECGFLSNPEEAALLATERYREELAATIGLSILDFLSQTRN